MTGILTFTFITRPGFPPKHSQSQPMYTTKGYNTSGDATFLGLFPPVKTDAGPSTRKYTQQKQG
ncbi:hypothetical protein CC2G_004824 [Coprinopsis cinerea AmutBmut pab1-1]|nr:hypothetical protein CC2G_004824 [Coprinopsis cinerea AmutBmut pab1-1]